MLYKLAVLFFAFVFMCGCNGQNPLDMLKDSKGGKNQERIRIGVSFPTKKETRWINDYEYIRQAASDADVDLIAYIADKNAAEQEEQCDEILKQGVSVLILAPHDARAAGNITAKAKAAGVKVISYDRLVLGSDIDFYVSFDNVKVGELQAKYITKKAPSGKYIVFSGAPTDNNSKMFHSGAMNVLQPFVSSGKIKIIEDSPIDNWDADIAEKLTDKFIEKHGTEIAAIIAPNDKTAGGVIQALENHHIGGLVAVSGQDADFEGARRVVAGLQSMTVFKNSQNLATAAIGAAMNMALGQPPPSNNVVYNGKGQIPSLLLEPLVADKENIIQMLSQSGHITAEEASKLEKQEKIVFANIDDIVMMPALTGSSH